MLFYAIISNAIESYSGVAPLEKKEVRITAECTKTECTFRVRDFGVGIHDSLVEKIFEKGITTKPNSNGMGLFIAKKITEIYEGDITFQSSPNRGTEFIVKLPVKSELPNANLPNKNA